MGILDVAKVFLYIFVLMLAIVLLKGLSTFEFSLRDKTVTYEDLYVQDFSPESKGLLKKLTAVTKPKDISDYLTLDINLRSQNKLILPIDTSFVFSSVDTGFIELKLKTNLPVTVPATLVWVDVDEQTRNIFELNPKVKGDQIIKSEFFPFQNFQRLELTFPSLISDRDSLTSKQITASCLLDYVKFVKEVKQKEVF